MPKWVKAAREKEVPPGTKKAVRVEGKRIVLVNLDGEIHALDNVCIHAGGPLNRGHLDGHLLICPWHDWPFDVRTGKLPHNPSLGVQRYPTRIDKGRIFVDCSREID